MVTCWREQKDHVHSHFYFFKENFSDESDENSERFYQDILLMKQHFRTLGCWQTTTKI